MSLSQVKLEIETDYQKRLKVYNDYVAKLEQQRKEFYEKNPDFPIKTMFMNVIAPPLKIQIEEE